jgi:hypothetical protein
VSRWSAPRLTAIATVLVVWGMWGFHNIPAIGYAAAAVAPGAIGATAAVKLTEEYSDHPGILIGALIPHLVGSFFGALWGISEAATSAADRVLTVGLSASPSWTARSSCAVAHLVGLARRARHRDATLHLGRLASLTCRLSGHSYSAS